MHQVHRSINFDTSMRLKALNMKHYNNTQPNSDTYLILSLTCPCIHTHAWVYTHTHTYTHIHSLIHTHTHSLTHTHTHTHTISQPLASPSAPVSLPNPWPIITSQTSNGILDEVFSTYPWSANSGEAKLQISGGFKKGIPEAAQILW